MAAQKVAAVTGASRGIGSCIAAELAARGYLVACLSRKGLGPEDRARSQKRPPIPQISPVMWVMTLP